MFLHIARHSPSYWLFHTWKASHCTFVCNHRDLVSLCDFSDSVYIVESGHHVAGYLVILSILRNVL